MDAIRAAVGDAKLTYLGYSYGTLLGATYAQLFPRTSGRWCSTARSTRSRTSSAGSERQAKGFERAFTNFTTWCAANPGAVPDRAGRPRRGDRRDGQGARSPRSRATDGREATAGWVFLRGDLVALHRVGLAGAGQGDRRPAGRRRRRASSTSPTSTRDREPDGTLLQPVRRQHRGELRRRRRGADGRADPAVAGRSGARSTRCSAPRWRSACCRARSGRASATRTRPARPTGAPPIVVVGTTGDPATPYENTAALAEHARHRARCSPGRARGTPPTRARPASPNAVDAYLIDLTVPQEGLRCPAR